MRILVWIALVAIALGLLIAVLRLRTPPPPPRYYQPVQPVGPAVMAPMHLEDQQRWRDVADVAYCPLFIAAFDYVPVHAGTDADGAETGAQVSGDRAEGHGEGASAQQHLGGDRAEGHGDSSGWQRRRQPGEKPLRQVTVHLQPGPRLRGTISVRGLKPNFAYQVKLLGTVPLRGPTAEAQGGRVEAWSSYQLGRLGRWWCEQCGWNLHDEDLAEHVQAGHDVTGYLLFDWLVTDQWGDAEHVFALDSSYHVLWRTDQRRKRRHDTWPQRYDLLREQYGYPGGTVGSTETVRIFAEWEVGRPTRGRVVAAPGRYRVLLNLTEESFHANLDERDELGGFWARVVQLPVEFEVSRGMGPR